MVVASALAKDRNERKVSVTAALCEKRHAMTECDFSFVFECLGVVLPVVKRDVGEELF